MHFPLWLRTSICRMPFLLGYRVQRSVRPLAGIDFSIFLSWPSSCHSWTLPGVMINRVTGHGTSGMKGSRLIASPDKGENESQRMEMICPKSTRLPGGGCPQYPLPGWSLWTRSPSLLTVPGSGAHGQPGSMSASIWQPSGTIPMHT